MRQILFLLLFTITGFTAKISFPWENESIKPYVAQDYSSLIGMKGFTKDLLEMHFTLYRGYVKNVNFLLEKLSNMQLNNQDSTYTFGALKRRLGWEFDGMRLHEMYFENLGGAKRPNTRSNLQHQIKKQFGSFAAWKENFISTGLIRGIGWVILIHDPESNRLVNLWINEHDVGHFVTCTPLLVMDVWEHAYITEFGLDRKKYIETFFENIDWEVVENRFQQKRGFHSKKAEQS